MVKIFLAALGLLTVVAVEAQQPNIIFLLLEGTSEDYYNGVGLQNIRNLILSDQNGINFPNMHTTTPMCCPSRTTIYSGLYQHNHQTVNNTLPGLCQVGDIYEQWVNGHSYATHLQDAGYYTCHVGNYLMGPTTNPAINMDPAPGWTNWRTDPGHQYGDYTLHNGSNPQFYGTDYPEDYHTEVIKVHALQCIDDYISSGAQAAGQPFHLTLSTAASHAPFTPAPEFADAVPDYECPRTPDFLYIEDPSEAKHWLISGQDRGYDDTQIAELDSICRNKVRTLMSVDKTFMAVMEALYNNSMVDNAYTILSGDHGYYVGQYAGSYGKMLPYDSSTKVPLWVSGPGIDGSAQKNASYVALNIDIAPTLMDMGGAGSDPQMDGISLLPYMTDPTTPSVRNAFLIEYVGLWGNFPQFEVAGANACPPGPDVMICYPTLNCICSGAHNNTWACYRNIDEENEINMEYCMFDDDVGFEEYYDLTTDPYQLHNTAYTTGPTSDFPTYQGLIDQLMACSGADCTLAPPSPPATS